MRIITSPQDLIGKDTETLGMRKQKVVPLYSKSLLASSDNVRGNLQLLDQCRIYWDSMRDFRNRRKRSRKYYRGDQWSDYIKDPDDPENSTITEEQYLMNQGKVPLKQNLIGKNVRNLIGQYLSNPAQAVVLSRAGENATLTEMFTNALQYALQNNNSKLLDISSFRELVLSGATFQKISYDYFQERDIEDVSVRNPSSARMFLNTDVEDIRLTDVRLVGEILDMPLDDLCCAFAKTPEDEEKIREIYSGILDRAYFTEYGLDTSTIDNLDFYLTKDLNKARLIEVWTLKKEWRIRAHDPLDGSYKITNYSYKEIAQENRNRIEMSKQIGMDEGKVPLIEAERRLEQVWYVKYLTPYGQCLFEGETPYAHQSHPYIITMHPLVDGEVWGIIEDMIDQQRYINRLFIQYDSILSASAKGVLMVPEDIVPDGMTPDDFSKEWVRFNGVIFYKPNPQHQKVPEQISANSTNIGLQEMIAWQLQMFQDTSGIHGAIQGKEPLSGTPASLYAQQAQNATINTLELMTYFENFLQQRSKKILKIIAQYYKEPRYLAINGKSLTPESKLYDPKVVENIDFDVVVTQGTDTPVYRQLIDNTLLELLKGQLIDLEMYLQQTSLPFADKLLQAVRERNQKAAQGQMPGQFSPELMAQVQQGVDPRFQQAIQQPTA